MTTSYTKALLSASITGRQIALSGTNAPGTLIHVTPGIATSLDEIWLYCTNNGTISTDVYTSWGGSLTSDLNQTTIQPLSRQLIADGKILQNGTVSAYISSSGTMAVDGYVNRIASDSNDPRVTDWVARVVLNGGATPSTATQQALTAFVQGLNSANLTSKMITLNCMVPDSLTACLTPLLRGQSYDPWINHNFVGGDLSVNGLTGNGSTKYLESGVNPARMNNSNLGFCVYSYAPGANGSDFNATTATISFFILSKFSDGNSYAGNGPATTQIITPSPGAGFYSSERTSGTVHKLYFANSSHAIAQIGATDATTFVSYPDLVAFVLAGNVSGSASQFSSSTLSFIGVHNGLSLSDTATLFTLVQNLRIALGGGFA